MRRRGRGEGTKGEENSNKWEDGFTFFFLSSCLLRKINVCFIYLSFHSTNCLSVSIELIVYQQIYEIIESFYHMMLLLLPLKIE